MKIAGAVAALLGVASVLSTRVTAQEAISAKQVERLKVAAKDAPMWGEFRAAVAEMDLHAADSVLDTMLLAGQSDKNVFDRILTMKLLTLASESYALDYGKRCLLANKAYDTAKYNDLYLAARLRDIARQMFAAAKYLRKNEMPDYSTLLPVQVMLWPEDKLEKAIRIGMAYQVVDLNKTEFPAHECQQKSDIGAFVLLLLNSLSIHDRYGARKSPINGDIVIDGARYWILMAGGMILSIGEHLARDDALFINTILKIECAKVGRSDTPDVVQMACQLALQGQ